MSHTKDLVHTVGVYEKTLIGSHEQELSPALIYVSRFKAAMVVSLLFVFLRLLGLFGLFGLFCVVGLIGLVGLASVLEIHNVHEIIEIITLSSNSQHTIPLQSSPMPLTSPIIAAVSPSNSISGSTLAFSILLRSHWSTSLRSHSCLGAEPSAFRTNSF